VLVNNAGIVTLSGVADVADDEWNEAVAVNQTGVFLGMRAVTHSMRRNGGGSIVNISSIYGVNAVPGYFAYQASKGAVVQMTRAAAVDLASDGIRVNCILPGLILTEMTKMEPEESVARDIEGTPLGRGGEASEVAQGALFLASDEASYVTGAVLPIDGGYTAK
jgi:NAD(P)-dependent dehydrogenase (short-subunit alcohol dehydrogenase family)